MEMTPKEVEREGRKQEGRGLCRVLACSEKRRGRNADGTRRIGARVCEKHWDVCKDVPSRGHDEFWDAFDRGEITAKGDELRLELKLLRAITDGCRLDMHKPDESPGEVTARVIGDHLDNAYGNEIKRRGSQEFVVVITRCDRKRAFNLATLIALARLAHVD